MSKGDVWGMLGTSGSHVLCMFHENCVDTHAQTITKYYTKYFKVLSGIIRYYQVLSGIIK